MDSIKEHPYIAGGVFLVFLFLFSRGSSGSGASGGSGASLQSQAIAAGVDTTLGAQSLAAQQAVDVARINALANRDAIFGQLAQAKMIGQIDQQNSVLNFVNQQATIGADIQKANLGFTQSVIGGKSFYRAQIAASNAEVQKAQIAADASKVNLSAGSQGNIISQGINAVAGLLGSIF